MGKFDGFMTPKDVATTILLRDDSSSEFRKVPVSDGFLMERSGDGKVTRAWLQSHKLARRYDGGRGATAGQVTVLVERDILFDVHGQLEQAEKPECGRDLNKRYIAQVATGVCYRHEKERGGRSWVDKYMLILGGTIFLEFCIMALVWLTKGGA